jgi:predicted transcriptional regulator
MKQKALHAIPIKQGKAFSKKIAKKEGKGRPMKSKKSLEKFNPSMIKNKEKRMEVVERRKKEMGKVKRLRRVYRSSYVVEVKQDRN